MREFGKKPYLSKSYDQMIKRTTDKQIFQQRLEKESEMKKPYQNTTYPEMEHFHPPVFPPPWEPDWSFPTGNTPNAGKGGARITSQYGDCNTLWQGVMAKYSAGGYDQGDGKWTNKSWVAALHDYTTTSPGVDKNGKSITCPLYYHCFPGKVYSPETNCRSRAGSWYPCMQYEWMQSCGYTLTRACAKNRSEIYGSPVCGYNCSFPCLGDDCDHLLVAWNLNKETICADYINGKGAGA